MPGRLHLKPSAAADSGAESDQQLGEDRDRVSLGLWRDRLNDLATEPVIDRLLGRRWPALGNRQGQRAARLRVILRWLTWQRRHRGLDHSAETSATAARAADSSTIALFEVNAAISDPTARLLTWRGRPRETSWISASASSEKSVSERPASARWCCT